MSSKKSAWGHPASAPSSLKGSPKRLFSSGLCQQSQVKEQETCSNPVVDPTANNIASKLCSLHIRCFAPLEDGTRCPYLRTSVSSLYCANHQSRPAGQNKSLNEECDQMIQSYHTACDPLRGPQPGLRFRRQCYEVPDFDRLSKDDQLQVLDDFDHTRRQVRECTQAREAHKRKCLYDTVESDGHRNYRLLVAEDKANCDTRYPLYKAMYTQAHGPIGGPSQIPVPVAAPKPKPFGAFSAFSLLEDESTPQDDQDDEETQEDVEDDSVSAPPTAAKGKKSKKKGKKKKTVVPIVPMVQVTPSVPQGPLGPPKGPPPSRPLPAPPLSAKEKTIQVMGDIESYMKTLSPEASPVESGPYSSPEDGGFFSWLPRVLPGTLKDTKKSGGSWGSRRRSKSKRRSSRRKRSLVRRRQ